MGKDFAIINLSEKRQVSKDREGWSWNPDFAGRRMRWGRNVPGVFFWIYLILAFLSDITGSAMVREFDHLHHLYVGMLKKYVEKRKVDYAGFKADAKALARYLSDADRKYLAAGGYAGNFLDYDWSLNERREVP